MSEGVKRPAKGIYVPPGRKRLEQNSTEKKPANIISNVPISQVNSNISNANTTSSTSTNQISKELNVESPVKDQISHTEPVSPRSLAPEKKEDNEKANVDSLISESTKEEEKKSETEEKNEAEIEKSPRSLAPEKKEDNEKATVDSLISESTKEEEKKSESESERERENKIDVEVELRGDTEIDSEIAPSHKNEVVQPISPRSLAPAQKEGNEIATVASVISAEDTELENEKERPSLKSEVEPTLAEKKDDENEKASLIPEPNSEEKKSEEKPIIKIEVESPPETKVNNSISQDKTQISSAENEAKPDTCSEESKSDSSTSENSNASSTPSRKKPDMQVYVPRRRLEAMEEEKGKKEKLKELEKLRQEQAAEREKKKLEEKKLQEEHQKRIEEAFFPERSTGIQRDNNSNNNHDDNSKFSNNGKNDEKNSKEKVIWNDLIDETPMGYYASKSKNNTGISPKREERKVTLNNENDNNNKKNSPTNSNTKKMNWRNHDENDGGNYDNSPMECIESYAHLVEAYDLANGMQLADIEDIFYGYPIKIKMVNKTNAILVFSSERDASDLLTNSVIAKSISIRPFSQASLESREIWLKNAAMFAMPKNARKSTTSVVATRLINNSLQLPRNAPKQPREILKREAK